MAPIFKKEVFRLGKKTPAVSCQLESRAKFAQNPMVEALPNSTWKLGIKLKLAQKPIE